MAIRARSRRRAPVVGLCLSLSIVLAVAWVPSAVAAAASTSLVSVASDGTQGNDPSSGPATSSDGRVVAFHSIATNLVAGDTNAEIDIFVRDRQTAETTRVSVASDGTQANDLSVLPAVSGDGRYVAFESDATNLVTGDSNVRRDIFVRNRQTPETTRVSVASDGTQANDLSVLPAVSGDGRYVAFESDATNLVTGDSNVRRDIFVRDRQTAETTRVSVASDGTQGSSEFGFSQGADASISADGRFVAFQAGFPN